MPRDLKDGIIFQANGDEQPRSPGGLYVILGTYSQNIHVSIRRKKTEIGRVKR